MLTGLTDDSAITSERLALAESEARVMIVINGMEPELDLQFKLSQAGFKVSTVTYLEDACDAVDRERPHLVMVDWDLPGMFTMNLVRHLRGQAVGPRLIALSRFAAEQHVVSGFELGVDDYVVKPFSVSELVARARAVLRPSLRHRDGATYLQFRELQMDPVERRLSIQGKNIGLRHMEFMLLEFLMQRPERAYSREVLLRQVWGADTQAGVRTVDMTVQRIRRALAQHDCGEYVETVRGVGYRLSTGNGG